MNMDRGLVEKVLLVAGGIAAGYALKEVIDEVIENMDGNMQIEPDYANIIQEDEI